MSVLGEALPRTLQRESFRARGNFLVSPRRCRYLRHGKAVPFDSATGEHVDSAVSRRRVSRFARKNSHRFAPRLVSTYAGFLRLLSYFTLYYFYKM